jgi:hypothetical protein
MFIYINSQAQCRVSANDFSTPSCSVWVKGEPVSVSNCYCILIYLGIHKLGL